MSKHTKGQWELHLPDFDEAWERFRTGDRPLPSEFACAHISSDRWRGFAEVVVVVDGDEDEEGMANARLIRAASELLHRLKIRTAACPCEGNTKRPLLYCEDCKADLALIEKTEGGPNE